MKTAIQTLPALAIHGVDPALFDAIDMSGYDEMLTVKDIKNTSISASTQRITLFTPKASLRFALVIPLEFHAPCLFNG